MGLRRSFFGLFFDFDKKKKSVHLKGETQAVSSQAVQQAPPKRRLSTTSAILIGCGATSLIILVAIVAICAIVLKESEVTTLPTTYSINEEVEVGKAKWILLEVKDRDGILRGSESEFPLLTEDKTTTGKFIEITLEVTNIGTITETWWSDPTLVDDKDREFKPADDVYEWIPDEKEALLKGLHPGVTCQFIWIYEVSKDTSGLKVKVKDIATPSKVEALIDLGL